jgi:hypothetical protein
LGETLAHDLTSVFFFAVTRPLAELGHNAKDVEDQVQVILSLLANGNDSMPVAQALFEGSRHGLATVRNLLSWLSRRPPAPGEDRLYCRKASLISPECMAHGAEGVVNSGSCLGPWKSVLQSGNFGVGFQVQGQLATYFSSMANERLRNHSPSQRGARFDYAKFEMKWETP